MSVMLPGGQAMVLVEPRQDRRKLPPCFGAQNDPGS
jgi:hypothetical protein